MLQICSKKNSIRDLLIFAFFILLSYRQLNPHPFSMSTCLFLSSVRQGWEGFNPSAGSSPGFRFFFRPDRGPGDPIMLRYFMILQYFAVSSSIKGSQFHCVRLVVVSSWTLPVLSKPSSSDFRDPHLGGAGFVVVIHPPSLKGFV